MNRKIVEASLDEVLEYYAKSYQLSVSEKLYKQESYVDTAKGKVFFVLYIEDHPVDVENHKKSIKFIPYD